MSDTSAETRARLAHATAKQIIQDGSDAALKYLGLPWFDRVETLVREVIDEALLRADAARETTPAVRPDPVAGTEEPPT